MASSHRDTGRIEIEGRFWLPDERYRCYGRLTFDVRTGPRIHLVDTNMTRRTPTGPHGPEPFEVLHGETLGGRPLTLVGVYPTGWRLEGFDGDTVDAMIDVVLDGLHVLQLEDIHAVHAGATIHGLHEVLTGGTVDGGVLHPGTDRFAADTLTVPLDGAELRLVAYRQPYWSRREEHTTLNVSVAWRFESPVDLLTIENEYVHVFQDLILFSTRRRSHVNSLSIAADEDLTHQVEVLRRSAPQEIDEREVYALAMNLGDQEDAADVIAQWYQLRKKVGPVWNVFFAALDRPESLLEDRLLGLLAFAEGYHRALHDQPPLSRSQQKSAEKAIKKALEDPAVRAVYRQALAHVNSETQGERLRMLTDRAMDVLGDEWWYVERDVFVKRLIHTRNWLVHWGSRLAYAVEDGRGMYELVRGLIVILYVNILLDLGLPYEAAARVIGSGWRLEGPPLPVFDDADGD